MGYIEYLRQKRRAGSLSSVLVRDSLSYLTDELTILKIFGETFSFTHTDIIWIHRWDLNETPDEKINRYMEKKFARRRLGGFLVPKNVADFLGVSVERLTGLLSELETEGRIIEIGYPDPSDYKKYLQDVELDADLLWELENLIQPPHKTPWWWWEDPPFDPFGGR